MPEGRSGPSGCLLLSRWKPLITVLITPILPGYSPSVESIAILVRVRGNPVGGRRSASGKGTPVLFFLKGKSRHAPGAFAMPMGVK